MLLVCSCGEHRAADIGAAGGAGVAGTHLFSVPVGIGARSQELRGFRRLAVARRIVELLVRHLFTRSKRAH